MVPNWKKKERKDAKDFRGNLQRASGSVWNQPGDILATLAQRDFSIDSKFTEKGSYSISLKTWNKICEESAWNERTPLISLTIQTTELVILSKEDFLRLNTQKD